MEHLAKRLADYICEKEIITEEMTEIYQYGFQCFLELSVSTVCSIIIALFLGMLPECLFFFLLFIPMRSYGGGLHMKTYFACFIGSCLILTASLLAVKYFTVPIPISFTLYLSAAILILFIGPVDHPNRKVDARENRTFIKRTYFTMFVSFLLALFFIFMQNTRYMLLQTIVFVFISATSLIGRLIYRQTYSKRHKYFLFTFQIFLSKIILR